MEEGLRGSVDRDLRASSPHTQMVNEEKNCLPCISYNICPLSGENQRCGGYNDTKLHKDLLAASVAEYKPQNSCVSCISYIEGVCPKVTYAHKICGSYNDKEYYEICVGLKLSQEDIE